MGETSYEAAYGRTHAALCRELADLPERERRASEVLGLLRRMGWRWSPALVADPPAEAAPPPVDWAEWRAVVHENALKHQSGREQQR